MVSLLLRDYEKVNYQDWVDRPSSVGVHEGGQLLVDVALAAAVDVQGFDFSSQPFVDLVVPVLHQTARSHDHGFLDLRFAVGTLPGNVHKLTVCAE